MTKNGNNKMQDDQLAKIADLIAAKVSHELQGQMKIEIETAIKNNNTVQNEKMQQWFGDMTPTQHTIQHNTMNRLLDRLDNFSHTFFTSIISKVAGWLITLVIVGFVLYTMRSGNIDIFK